ncbi:LytR family transcriptional regulator [Blastococcus sp. TF02-8]|uniref:LCP family protein n=1 Tax=Blastococcus sp. TF02-8 TaxID=2250574 RepID=UPI000DEA9ED4|nr:LCP family protein [Blastococcus sp. TF02-8]RBY96250.1 LytR family transcriptional regulator [Blastococcus sp. TF02-8]
MNSDDETGADDRTPLGLDDLDRDDDPAQRSHGGRRALAAVTAFVLILVLVLGGVALFLVDRYAGNVDKVGDVFAGLDEDTRPAPATPAEGGGDPLTFLLVGSDTRAAPQDGELPGGRSDAIMVVRFTADRKHAQLISIPRDSWVDIPGRGLNKINASYAFGGPTLLIQTVEQLTQLRIDHYVAIDFEGLIQVTDDLGGVDVDVASTTKNGPYTFEAGNIHLDGDQARWYLAERKTLPGGDFDRVKRQQQYLQSMFSKLFSADTFSSPTRLDGALRAVTSAVAVDDGLGNNEMLSLALSLRDVTPENIDFFTAPVLGTGMEGPASVVYLDNTACERMWSYLRNDTLGKNAAEFEADALPDVPR